MVERSITDEWLSSCDFKWRQDDRQPNKHWTLKINIPDDRSLCWNTVSIEVQRCGWENQHGEYIGDPQSWMLWLTDTFDRTAFLGKIRLQKEIIGLAEIISKRPWNPQTHIYGQAWPEGSHALIRKAAAPMTPVIDRGLHE
jgi:hypothetical protein